MPYRMSSPQWTDVGPCLRLELGPELDLGLLLPSTQATVIVSKVV